MTKSAKAFTGFLSLNLIACLLGNFVDQYDLFLFSSIRVSSLKSLGLEGQAVLESGIFLLNIQLLGMFIGGFLGGILGDKIGRLSILFGSIIVYSLANLANAYVHTVPEYAFCRFFAGLGLAGELGACITVILEILPIAIRGYGTMLLMAFGHVAAITASVLSNLVDWRTNFIIGGTMGLFILLLRMSAKEPEIFLKVTQSNIQRGNFFTLVSNWKNLKKYIACILTSTPTWFCFAVLVIFAPEIGPHLGVTEKIQPEKYMPLYFIGLVLGDISSGVLGQVFKTRKLIILTYISALILLSVYYLTQRHMTLTELSILVALFGFFSSYTVLSFTLAAEQFGTNVRATAATTTPNFVRASGILFTASFGFLKLKLGIIPAAATVGFFGLGAAFLSALSLKDTFGKDLDYVEGADAETYFVRPGRSDLEDRLAKAPS